MKLEFEWEDGWFDREYRVTRNNELIEKLGGNPTLSQLREAERNHGGPLERLDLWQSGLVCSDCGKEINARFTADLQENLLCWECASQSAPEEHQGFTSNTDPTKAVLSKSSLHKKSLCDYVINVATGCKHGCEFCYVPTTPAIENREDMLNEQANVEDSQQEWGSYLLYRDDLPERLHDVLENEDDWKETDRGRGAVMLSSGTDCYQDRRAAQITRGCVQELVKHDKPVRILTRSPAVVRDIDIFQAADGLVTVGSSIPSFDTGLVKALEPNAPPPSARYEALDEIQRTGVPVFVSMSPTYPTMDEDDFWKLLTFFKGLNPEVIFHEPINPRGKNFQMCVNAVDKTGFTGIADELRKLQDHQYWVEYAVEQINLVQQLADEIGVTVHSWPDRELIQSTSGELCRKLKAMQKAVSPEDFARKTPDLSKNKSQSQIAEDPEAIQRMV
jgi:DNA repair photolyase